MCLLAGFLYLLGSFFLLCCDLILCRLPDFFQRGLFFFLSLCHCFRQLALCIFHGFSCFFSQCFQFLICFHFGRCKRFFFFFFQSGDLRFGIFFCRFSCLSFLVHCRLEFLFFLLQLHSHLIQEIHLLGCGIQLKFRLGQLVFQFLAPLFFFCKIGFCLQLCLGYFFHKHFADLDLRNIPVLDDFFFDFFDELRLDRLPFFFREFCHIPLIRLKNTFKYGIIGDEVNVHLQKILFIKLQRGVLLLDGISHLIVALDKLPQLVALSIVRIFHHQVGPLDRAPHLGAAIHQITERTGAQRPRQTAHAVDSFKEIHMVGITFHIALPVFDRHFDFIGNFFICVIDLALHTHDIACLIAGRPKDDICSLIHKGEQALNQVIDEPVLVQVKTLLAGDI